MSTKQIRLGVALTLVLAVGAQVAATRPLVARRLGVTREGEP